MPVIREEWVNECQSSLDMVQDKQNSEWTQAWPNHMPVLFSTGSETLSSLGNPFVSGLPCRAELVNCEPCNQLHRTAAHASLLWNSEQEQQV